MYQTGTATNTSTLLSALATFAASAGWTVDLNTINAGTGYLAMHKGAAYFWWAPATDNTSTSGYAVALWGATGYTSGAAVTSQPNVSPEQYADFTTAGPFIGYHFFSTTGAAAYLHVAVEMTGGVYTHFCVGQTSTIGGGNLLYVTAEGFPSPTSNYSSYPLQYKNHVFSADGWGNGASSISRGAYGGTVDGSFKWFIPYLNGSTASRLLTSFSKDTAMALSINSMACSPNTFNGIPIFIPFQFFAERSSGNVYSFVGEAIDARLVDMTNEAPQAEITIGTDVWKLFPLISNNPAINVYGATYYSTYPYGIAYRKNA